MRASSLLDARKAYHLSDIGPDASSRLRASSNAFENAVVRYVLASDVEAAKLQNVVRSIANVPTYHRTDGVDGANDPRFTELGRVRPCAFSALFRYMHISDGASQMSADARPAIDHNHSSTQPHARREA